MSTRRFTLHPTGDGTKTNIGYSASGVGTQAWSRLNDHSNYSSYVYAVGGANGSCFLQMSDPPSAATAVTGVTVVIDKGGFLFVDDTCTISAQVFASDETTAYTNAVVVGDQTAPSFNWDTVSAALPLTAAGIAATWSGWSGATVKLTWTYTRVSTTDNAELRVMRVQLRGTYTSTSELIGFGIACGHSSSVDAPAVAGWSIWDDQTFDVVDPLYNEVNNDFYGAAINPSGTFALVGSSGASRMLKLNSDGTVTEAFTLGAMGDSGSPGELHWVSDSLFSAKRWGSNFIDVYSFTGSSASLIQSISTGSSEYYRHAWTPSGSHVLVFGSAPALYAWNGSSFTQGTVSGLPAGQDWACYGAFNPDSTLAVISYYTAGALHLRLYSLSGNALTSVGDLADPGYSGAMPDMRWSSTGHLATSGFDVYKQTGPTTVEKIRHGSGANASQYIAWAKNASCLLGTQTQVAYKRLGTIFTNINSPTPWNASNSQGLQADTDGFDAVTWEEVYPQNDIVRGWSVGSGYAVGLTSGTYTQRYFPTPIGVVSRGDPTWATANSGVGTTDSYAYTVTSSTQEAFAAWNINGKYWVQQMLLRFNVNLPSTATVTAATLGIFGAQYDTGNRPELEVFGYNFGATVEVDDFRSGSALSALGAISSQTFATGWQTVSNPSLVSHVQQNRTGAACLVLADGRQRTGANPPLNSTAAYISLAEASDRLPYLDVTFTIP